MEIRPITLREANDFVVRYHRHHKAERKRNVKQESNRKRRQIGRVLRNADEKGWL